MRLIHIVCLSAFGLLGAACSKDKPEPLVPAAGTVQRVEKATEDMANVRCDHEQRCNEIGEGKKYSDRNHCLGVMRKEAGESLNSCHKGIDENDLRQCMTELQNQDCDGLFEGIGEMKACGMDDLCAE